MISFAAVMILSSSTPQLNAFHEFQPKAGSFPFSEISTDILTQVDNFILLHLAVPRHLYLGVLLELQEQLKRAFCLFPVGQVKPRIPWEVPIYLKSEILILAFFFLILPPRLLLIT